MSSGSINIADILESHAAIIGDRIAVITDDCFYTYGEINHRANKLANHLLACGFKAGDHIAIHSRNRIEWIDAFYACLKIRAVPININYRYTKNELKYLYNNSHARGVIVSQEFYDDVASIYSELPKLRWVGTIETMYENAVRHVKAIQDFEKRSGDDLYITYTGGTTGMPKGVMWRQEDLIYAAMNKSRGDLPIENAPQISLEALDRPNQTRIMCNSPMMHASGQWMMGSALMIGAIFVLYTQKSFTGPECLALAEKAEVNSMNVIGDGMASVIIDELNKNKYNLSSLISINNGGAFLSEDNKNKILQLLPGRFVMDVYGGSEIGGVLTKIHTNDNKSNFNNNTLIKVFDDSLNECDPNILGKIGKSGHIPLGYYNDLDKTNEVFKVINGIRWSIPGDLGYKDEHGDIILRGRDSLCINTGGEKVYPDEVESVVRSYPGIHDAVVFGTPHPVWGERVSCCIVCDGFVDIDKIKAYCKTNLADYKVPKVFNMIESIPRNEIGKIDYQSLKLRALQ